MHQPDIKTGYNLGSKGRKTKKNTINKRYGKQYRKEITKNIIAIKNYDYTSQKTSL